MEKSQLFIKITVRGFDGVLTPTLKYLINEHTRLTIAMLSPTFEKS